LAQLLFGFLALSDSIGAVSEGVKRSHSSTSKFRKYRQWVSGGQNAHRNVKQGTKYNVMFRLLFELAETVGIACFPIFCEL